LGFPVFDKISKDTIKKREILIINGRNIHAEGGLIDKGFVVFKG